MNRRCPFCKAKAVDITCDGETPAKFMCVGPECHEWRDGDEPEPEPDDTDDVPEISVDAIADALAKRLQPSRQSWTTRLFGTR